MAQKILLLGGCGYAGTAIYDHFKKVGCGCRLNSVDLEWYGKTIAENWQKDYATLDPWELKKYDTIILVAGHSSVPMCKNARPALYNNVVNFVNLLDKIGEKQKLIYFSSSSVYDGTYNAREVDNLPEVNSYYDLTKREIDYYAVLSGKRVYGLRLGTINGFSRNLREDIMINKMFYSAKRKGYIEVTNVNTTRPILDIEDMCSAVWLMTHADYGDPAVYNLASFNARVGKIAMTVGNILGVDVLYRGDTPGYDFSMSLARFQSVYHFSPRDRAPEEAIANIVEGLAANTPEYLGVRQSRDYE